MSTRRILALLVVLALSLALCSIPAGSATLQRTSVTGDESVTAGPSFRDGDDGEDIDTGDDDRWGNIDPIQGDSGNGEAGGDDDNVNGDMGSDRIFGRVSVLQIGVRNVLGFLVMML